MWKNVLETCKQVSIKNALVLTLKGAVCRIWGGILAEMEYITLMIML